jgi:hypothetical protein
LKARVLNWYARSVRGQKLITLFYLICINLLKE